MLCGGAVTEVLYVVTDFDMHTLNCRRFAGKHSNCESWTSVICLHESHVYGLGAHVGFTISPLKHVAPLSIDSHSLSITYDSTLENDVIIETAYT